MKTYLKYLIYVMILLISSCYQRGKGSQNILSHNQALISNQSIQRYGSVIRVKPEKLMEYKELHANPWPEINQMISVCNIRNYSIYYKDGYLFSYFEYVGDDFKTDMQKMAADSLTREWWKLTDPCQVPLKSRKEGEWWASMEELYHLE
ncbi:MAG: L-rhamnose mutarotase [Bacteroidales bacterium]|nr:L-rhamnose mutarotase [Bacteroidales bacterium]